MSTTEEHLSEITTACPTWCTLEPGHPMEAVTRLDDDPHEPPCSTHDDPSFGKFISISVLEFADSPGAMEYDIHLCSDNEADPIMTREELIQLSRDALAAAA